MGKDKKAPVKVPKGTRDWFGPDMEIRNDIFERIRGVFKDYDIPELDTPVFELKDILTEKYGEDSKLIYDLADQGGELSSLRYDLTVPFARWLAMENRQKCIRFQIAKVYRRDNPAMTKGRLREFYQCDIDFAGAYDAMIPETELLEITYKIFEALGWEGRYTIKINNRKILDGIFQVCGVPTEKLRTISSAVDKLDKSPWEEVRREMTEDKGLDREVADRIGEYAQLRGGRDLLERLQKDEKLSANESARAGLADMDKLFTYLDPRVMDRISFDMSLARGLDYYTGAIWEAVTEGSAPQTREGQDLQNTAKREQRKPKKQNSEVDGDDDRSNDPTIGVGSVAAGGRYDKLVGTFSGKQDIPCVGISFGIDRIIAITKQRRAADASAAVTRERKADVYVMAFGSGLFKERKAVVNRLREVNVRTQYFWKEKPKFDRQFKEAEDLGVPYTIILGEDELAAGKCKIKELGLPEGDPEKDGVLVEMSKLEEEVKRRLRKFDAVATLTNNLESTSVDDVASWSAKDLDAEENQLQMRLAKIEEARKKK